MVQGHDGYLKLWALSEPRIAADFILLDEAQDANRVMLDVLRKQPAQMVYEPKNRGARSEQTEQRLHHTLGIVLDASDITRRIPCI